MSTTETRPDAAADGAGASEHALLEAARAGSTGAFAVLYERHRSFAVAAARRALPSAQASAAEDVAETAFLRVFTALRNGKGPTDELRRYLATAVRHEAWRSQRRLRRQSELVDRWSVDEAARIDHQADVGDGGIDVRGREESLGSHVLLSEAFRSLPERWRQVLWLTEVEGHKPAEIGQMLGVSAGSVSALAYRARQGLLGAYVSAYSSRSDEACQQIADRLAAYVAGGRDDDAFPDVAAHLEGCQSCRELSRGVDVAVAGLAVALPVTALSAGSWASGLGTFGSLAPVAGAGAGGAGGGGAAGASGGAGGALAAAVAAVVAVVAVVTGVAVANRGEQAPPEAAAAPIEGGGTSSTVVRERTIGEVVAGSGGEGSAPITAAPPILPAPSTTAPASTTSAPTTEARPAAPDPAPPARPILTTPRAPSTSVPSPPTTVPAPSTTTTSTSTTTTTSSTTTTSTTTTTPPASQLRGRVLVQPSAEAPLVGLGGVTLRVVSLLGHAGAVTAADGTFALGGLPRGLAWVVAEVSAAYRPRDGIDPWTGGATWEATLGLVWVGSDPVQLDDLVLLPR